MYLGFRGEGFGQVPFKTSKGAVSYARMLNSPAAKGDHCHRSFEAAFLKQKLHMVTENGYGRYTRTQSRPSFPFNFLGGGFPWKPL